MSYGFLLPNQRSNRVTTMKEFLLEQYSTVEIWFIPEPGYTLELHFNVIRYYNMQYISNLHLTVSSCSQHNHQNHSTLLYLFTRRGITTSSPEHKQFPTWRCEQNELINQSINQPINELINESINELINKLIKELINVSVTSSAS